MGLVALLFICCYFAMLIKSVSSQLNLPSKNLVRFELCIYQYPSHYPHKTLALFLGYKYWVAWPSSFAASATHPQWSLELRFAGVLSVEQHPMCCSMVPAVTPELKQGSAIVALCDSISTSLISTSLAIDSGRKGFYFCHCWSATLQSIVEENAQDRTSGMETKWTIWVH